MSYDIARIFVSPATDDNCTPTEGYYVEFGLGSNCTPYTFDDNMEVVTPETADAVILSYGNYNILFLPDENGWFLANKIPPRFTRPGFCENFSTKTPDGMEVMALAIGHLLNWGDSFGEEDILETIKENSPVA